MEGTTRRTTPSSITMHDVLRDRHDIEHSAMRKHHSKSAQVGAAGCGAWDGHTCSHLSSSPTSDTAMSWNLDFSAALQTLRERFSCHPLSTLESRSRGHSPALWDHRGDPGRPSERPPRISYFVPGMDGNSWDKSLILGQNPGTVGGVATPLSGRLRARRGGKH